MRVGPGKAHQLELADLHLFCELNSLRALLLRPKTVLFDKHVRQPMETLPPGTWAATRDKRRSARMGFAT